MKHLRNTVRLIGNIGTEPEVKTFTNGKIMARFSLATTEAYNNKEGEKIFNTTWHNIVAWGNTAKLAEKICKKGFRIAVDGKLNNRTYEDGKGEKKYITEVVADELMIVGETKKLAEEVKKD